MNDYVRRLNMDRNPVRKRTDMPMVGVGVFVKKDDKYALSRRKPPLHGAGEYSLPGGHIEYFETIEQTARNEVREETGMEIENVRILTAADSIFPKEQLHYVTVFLTADWSSGELRNLEPDKHEDWGWYDPDKFPEPHFEGLDEALKVLCNNS